MIDSGSSGHGQSALFPAYNLLFVQRAHRLIAMGYDQLAASDYAEADEENISGDLADAMDANLIEPAELWMKYFSVHNERPVKDSKGKRKGKKRQRIDIHITSSCESSKRQGYSLEAKRLS